MTKTKKATKRKPIKPFVLKNIKAKEFMALLDIHGACGEAKDWAKGKSLKQVFKYCNRDSWLGWLLFIMTDYTYSSWATGYEIRYHTPEQTAEWGGPLRAERVKRRANVVFNKYSGTWEASQRAAADVYRQHYTVV
jgi:hypothetical protein